MSFRTHWNAGPCHVYGLVDPRDDSIFYIGVSIDVFRRLNDHRHDPASSAWRRVNEIEALGRFVEVRVFMTFPTRIEAEAVEKFLIRTLPGLVNVAEQKII